MTFELNIKCLWQHSATSNLLEITKIEWRETSDPIVVTAHSLRQLQPGNWKTPIKPGTEEQANLLSALQEFTKFPQFKNTHPLTRYLVKDSSVRVNLQLLTMRQPAQNATKQTTI